MINITQHLPTPDEGYELKLKGGGLRRSGNEWRLTLDIEQAETKAPTPLEIMEKVVLSEDATKDDIQRMEVYLARKYDLEDRLPDDHPYKYQKIDISMLPITAHEVEGVKQ